jgi:hypothetical protein
MKAAIKSVSGKASTPYKTSIEVYVAADVSVHLEIV